MKINIIYTIDGLSLFIPSKDGGVIFIRNTNKQAANQHIRGAL